MNMYKLPKELLLKIICERDSVDYLTTDECLELMKKIQNRIYANAEKDIKDFLPLCEEDYKFIDFIKIEKYINVLYYI